MNDERCTEAIRILMPVRLKRAIEARARQERRPVGMMGRLLLEDALAAKIAKGAQE